ncbi:MAG: Eco57I restriction-modification methylase domain-containing protein [Sphingomonadales bacterium]
MREEISTAFRVAQSHFDAFAKLESPSPDATRRFVSGLLKEAFAFDDLQSAEAPVALIASDRVPVVVVPPDELLDRRSPTLSVDRSRSPAFALQDYLNDKEEALWGMATNGLSIRLMRDNASLTRPAYIEADLAQIFMNEDIASFAVLWLVIHRSRFGAEGTPATDCALERWRDAGSKEGEASRDRLADQVQIALKVLGSGFLEANPELAGRLQSGEENLTDWFNELLRLVYRLIFLMVAEDRNLLHPTDAKPEACALYARGYSLASLRKHCYRAASWDKHHDRYEGIKIVFRALTHGQDALGLPALGGLFAGDRLPRLETAKLRNKAFMEALYRLSWLSDKTSMVPVNWRAMETEELGSVYETLLELQPQLGGDGKTLIFASDAAEQKGNQRKTTGSYYTPDSLVQALLDTALDPVLDKTETEANDPEAALLGLSVIDPACGSGHFLLAAARRIATRLARVRAEGTPSLADFRHALRDVARCCIHGVDRNPMAVELTKVALWIETVDPGLPLGFFDAQIRCGDALLGVFDLKAVEQGIPAAAYKPLTGDDKPVAAHYKKKNAAEVKERDKIDQGFGFNRQQDYMREFAAVRALPENTLADVEAKAARLKALSAEGAGSWVLSRACDLYVAAFLLSKKQGGQFAGLDGMPVRGRETVPTSGALWEYLRGVTPFGPMFAAAIDAAQSAHAFHWPLEFPDVMAGGGFDVVLGNPPWERIKLQEKEFFAARDTEIATAANKAARDRLIKALAAAEEGSAKRALFDAFESEKRLSEALSTFVRAPAKEGGRFPLTGTGDVNTYALFAELFAMLGRGRAGVIVPTGVATDATTAPFFAHLVENRRLAKLVDFENRKKLFPAVDSRMKFSLLTLGRDEEAAHFAFFLTDPAQLTEPERNFALSPETIASLNPNTKTTPVFRSRMDAELTTKIYASAPVLLEEEKGDEGDPWGVSFMAMFHMSGDSGLFRTAAQLTEDGFSMQGVDWISDAQRYVPLYEAKMTSFFDHRAAGYGGRGDNRGYRVLPETSNDDHADTKFEVEPFYWVNADAVSERISKKNWEKSYLLGWKDVTAATNERTLVSCVIPIAGAGDTFLLMMPGEAYQAQLVGIYANLASLILDYATRQKIGGLHLKYNIVKQLPILPPTFYSEPRLNFVTPRVLELTYTSHSLAPFACDLGYEGEPFVWDEDRRASLRAELDAFYARAYGLDRDELRYILDPADVMGPDYPSETFRVLKEKEIKKHGEYRTQRLVLEAWDRMEADGVFAELGMAVAGAVEPAAQAAQPFDPSALPDDALVRVVQTPGDAGAALAATLKALNGSVPARRVRMAAVMMLEPRLLTPLLSEASAQEWRRLVGQEAEPLQGNVTGFVQRTNPAWGAALSNHRGNGRLIEDLAAGTWAAGAGLEAFDTSGWPDGCAAFVLDALAALDLDQAATQLPDEIERWVRDAAVA